MPSNLPKPHKCEGVTKRLFLGVTRYIRNCDAAYIILIYFVCHLPLLLLWEAKYWDDWLIFGVTDDDLIQTFVDAGFKWVGYLHLALRAWGPEGYKLVTFIALLVPPLAILNILKTLGLPRRQAFWTAALTIALPFFFSRVAAINALSAVFMAIFFIAWVLLLTDKNGIRGFLLSIIAAALFSVSMVYSSLASFYLVALITLAYKQHTKSRMVSINSVIALAPLFVFLGLRMTFSPAGNYAGYNAINLSPANIALTFIKTTVELVNPSTPAGAFLLFFVTPIVALGVFLSFVSRSSIFGRLRFHLLAIGAIGFAIAPYLVAGKYPSFLDWGSRLQLLLPFGFALLLVESEQRIRAYLRLRSGLRLNFILPVCLIFSIGLWWDNYIDYEVDWIKQLAIVDAMKQQPSLTAYNSFIVADDATYLNAHGRSYRFYEVAGMLRAGGVENAEIVTTNFEVLSALKSGTSWSELRNNMNPFINGLYLLRRSQVNEKIALLNFSSVPAAGVFKVQIAIKAWFLKIRKGEKSLKPLLDSVVLSVHDVTAKYSDAIRKQ